MKKRKAGKADIPMDGEGNYIYEAVKLTNYDGDSFRLTVKKRWDFGFGIHITQEYHIPTRIKGVDTPEMRDKRPDWKAAARLAKRIAQEFVGHEHVTFVSMDKPDKYGRALGDFVKDDGNTLSKYLIEQGLGVAYEGQNKALVQAAHAENVAYLKATGQI